MKPSRTIFAQVLFPVASAVLLTWWAGDRYSAGLGSLLTACLLLLRDGFLPPGPPVSDLLQPWLASVVWTIFLVWLFHTRIVHRLRPAPSMRPRLTTDNHAGMKARRHSGGIALTVLLLACSSPMFVVVHPALQGDLVSTRLLPPLSSGVVRLHLPPPADTDGLQHIYRRAMAVFVPGSYELSGSVGLEGSESVGRFDAAVGTRSVLFLFGTDDVGRDVFSRVLAGTQVSLWIGLLAAAGALLLGFVVGFFSAWAGRLTDAILMRMTDLVLAIPPLFLALGAVAVLQPSPASLVVVLAVTGWMGVARVIRAEVRTLRQKEFVLAARLLNVRAPGIIWNHILPNLKPVITTAFVLQFGTAVLAESALGFLGLGVRPPTPSWGTMLGESLGFLHTAWWLGVLPGIALAALLVVAHVYGNSLKTRPA